MDRKYNENHDPDDGRFASGDGGGSGGKLYRSEGGGAKIDRDGFTFSQAYIDQERRDFESRFGVSASSSETELANAIVQAAADEGDAGMAFLDILAEQYGLGGYAGARRRAKKSEPRPGAHKVYRSIAFGL